MKKFISFIIALMFIILNINAQNQQIIIGKNYVKPNEITLVAERGASTSIKFDLNELNLIEVATDYGLANKITSTKAPVILEAGVPELIYLPTAIIIPDVGSAELDIVYGEYTEIENIEIVPSKGNLPRNIDPKTVPYVKGKVYNDDAFFPGTLATINETFIMRDVRGLTLFAYPVQYNPVTKVLRIYSEITVTVNFNDNEGINEFINQKRHQTIDPAFNEMYNNMFINYGSLSRAYPTGEEGELLIICHTAFMDDMKPYVDWKRTIGRKTTMISTAETGTTAAGIKTYIKDYYDAPENNLAYVLFVGDAPQIPAHNSLGQISDIFYGQFYSGNYMDILIGRMSAETIAHVQTQVQRTIHYERDITTTDTWLSTGIGLAHNEGTGQGHDGGENDYVHMDNIRDRLLDHGYNPVYQEYHGDCPGIPNTSIAQISQRFNAGASMANYCSHGNQAAWSFGPYGALSYTNTHVNQLQNAGMLPFIYSVACNNGEFMGYTCFAEAWMRATQNNQPTGAIATFMAIRSIGWEPTHTAQDEFVNICIDLPSPYPGQQPGMKRTFAGACLNSTQKMLMRHGPGNGNLQDYLSWTVFGDPTLMFRTKTPEEMTIIHLPNIPLGAGEFSVDCDAEGALATVSYIDENDEVIILGTTVVVDGVAEIVFDKPATTMELTLAITGFNKVTYLNSIFIEEEMVLPIPLNLTYIVENVNHVVLSWNTPEKHDGLTLEGYNIYRNDMLITQEPVREALIYTDIVPQNGEYKYVVTALYLYEATLESNPSNPVTVVLTGLSINALSGAQAFSIFPNPAGEEITIKEEGFNYVEIYDVTGRKLSFHHLITSSSHQKINVSHLESGIYFVKIYSNNNQVVTKRLAIMK